MVVVRSRSDRARVFSGTQTTYAPSRGEYSAQPGGGLGASPFFAAGSSGDFWAEPAVRGNARERARAVTRARGRTMESSCTRRAWQAVVNQSEGRTGRQRNSPRLYPAPGRVRRAADTTGMPSPHGCPWVSAVSGLGSACSEQGDHCPADRVRVVAIGATPGRSGKGIPSPSGGPPRRNDPAEVLGDRGQPRP